MPKGNKVVWWVVVLAIVIAGVWYYSSQSSKAPEGSVTTLYTETIKVGAALPLTGDAQAYGIPLKNAIELAVSHINEKMGGVGGKKLEVVYEDDKCSGKDAANAIQKLVNVDQVKFVIGGACSGATLAMAPVATSAKVVLMSPSATSPDVTTKGGDYVFRLAPSDALAGKIGAEYAYNKLDAKKVAVVSESTDYAAGLRKVFTGRFRELGGSVVVDEVYNSDISDFRTVVTKVKAVNPDVIYLVPQTPATGVNLIKRIKSQGLTAKLLTAEVLAGRNLVVSNGTDLEGLTAIEPSIDETKEVTRSYQAMYRAKYGEPSFPAFEAMAWDITHLVRDGIMAIGYDGEALKNWLYTIKDRQGASGPITIDANGDNGIATYRVSKVNSGKQETVEYIAGSAQ